MGIKEFYKLSVIVFCLLAMVACSTSKKRTMSENESAAHQGAYSMGLGSEDNLQGSDLAASYSTKAPTNQIYYFNFDQSRLHSEYLPSIDAQAKYLMEHPKARILLAGHTDSRGSREYNIALGERRAQSVVTRMVMDGANKNQLRVVSYGSEKPVALGGADEDHAKNRRVELVYEVLE